MSRSSDQYAMPVPVPPIGKLQGHAAGHQTSHAVNTFNRFYRVLFSLPFFLFCCFISMGFPGMQAQAQFSQTSKMDPSDTRSITKANFLFHFAASNEWPSAYTEGPFRLAVVGNPSLHAILADKYAMKFIGSQPLEITAYEDVQALENAPFSHVIYCEESGASLTRVAKSIQGKPVLLISDAPDGLEYGALINFVAVNNRIRYEIDSEEAVRRDLLIGNRILSWAVK